MKQEELQVILENHKKWLMGEDGGCRADLCDANLCGANLCDADLRGADLCDADLCDAVGGKRYVSDDDEFWHMARPAWCPIIGELPEQHGRIIDEAVFCENVVKYSHQSTKTIGKALDATPTIIDMTPIDAERSET